MADQKTVVTPLTSGVPENQVTALRAASAGGEATVAYMAQSRDTIQLFKNMNDGTSTWVESTTDDEASNPVMYLQAGDMSIVITCDLANAVLAAPAGPAASDGPKYNGYASITINSGQYSVWNSFAQVVAPTVSSALALDLVRKYVKAVKKIVYNAMAGDADVAALDGVAAGEIEGDEILVEAGCFGPIAEVVVLAVCAFIMFDHKTFHHLQLNNLTGYDLRWDISYQGFGSLRQAPAHSTADREPLHVFDAGGGIAPPGVKPVRTYTNGSFSFQNDTTLGVGYYGVGYVMSLRLFLPKTTNEVYSAKMLFMIPYDGSNSLFCSFDDGTDAKTYFEDHKSVNTVTAFSALSADQAYKLSLTYDYLRGEHPIPGSTKNKSGYYYNSLATIEQVSLKVA
jgi:hypothetical protein